MTKNTRFSPEIRQRAVRMVIEVRNDYGSQWAAISSIAPKIGCTPETLRIWLRQYERDAGGGDGGLTTTERQHLKECSALTGRASPLRGSDGFHALNPVLYFAACIFHAPQSCSSPSMTAGICSLLTNSLFITLFSREHCRDVMAAGAQLLKTRHHEVEY